MRFEHVLIRGVLVAFLYQEPLLFLIGFRSAWLAARADERIRAAQLEPMHRDIELARPYSRGRVTIRRIDHVIRPAVPYDHRACTVIAFRNTPLEVAVFHRMVFDHHREPLVRRLQRWSPRHRPRSQDVFHLEAEIVMELARGMLLHHKFSAAWR